MSSQSASSQSNWKVGALSRIDPSRTALLVVDLQNDFCSPDGALAALGSDVSPCRSVAERVREFLPRVRNLLGLVAFFQLVYDVDKMSDSQKERLIKNGKPVICIPGTAGVQLYISPDPTDQVFIKHRYSAFTNEQFRNTLERLGVTSVAVVGVDTHICVEGTIRHGYDLGYRMLVLPDLVGTRQSEIVRHDNSIALCDKYFALNVSSGDFLNVLRDHKPIDTLSRTPGV